MIQKMIVMLLSVVWGRIQERTWNFGHLVHETWPRTCVRSVFKFYKKQTKSENHETCWDVVISYVEAMIKISEVFVHVVMYDAYKPGYLRNFRVCRVPRIRHSAKKVLNFFKKISSLPSAFIGALGKEISKKNLCRAPCQGHSAKYFLKKKSLPSA